MKRMLSLALCLMMVSAAAAQNAADDKDKNKKDANALYEKKGDKERIYKVPYEQMFTACMKAASEENVVEFQDKESGVITFKTGTSMASWGFKVSISLTKIEDGKTRIKLTTQKTRGQLVAWGAGGRTAEKFFKGLDKQLRILKEADTKN